MTAFERRKLERAWRRWKRLVSRTARQHTKGGGPTVRKYRANFGDGTTSREYVDKRDARREKWARAGIVQYRTSIEARTGAGTWRTVEPSRASLNGPPITEVRS